MLRKGSSGVALIATALIAPATWEPDLQGLQASLDAAGENLYEPPLGILTLASLLGRAGVPTSVFDLNGLVRRLCFEAPDELDGDLCRLAAPAIAGLQADIFAFGTICSSYPMTIRVAREVKRLRPETRIVFGGPQASAVDVRTLEVFPFVDAVVRGEADEILVAAFEEIGSRVPVRTPGVTWRAGERIVRNPNAPVVLDLDRIAEPAFHLHDAIDRLKYLPIEIGRGCPFACTFCSTNDFFRRRFRMRSPARVIAEMDRLNGLYGITEFDLVHDMFTVDRRLVMEFCRSMIAHGKSYRWRCSARTDFVDRELIDLMREAGCVRVFFGVETGSQRLQKVIDKELDVAESAAAVETAAELGVRCTVSLIVGFPEETAEDVAATGKFALDSARFDTASVEVGLLAALSGTPVFKANRELLFFDGLYSDQSHQTWEQNEFDRQLIEKHLDLFPNFWGLPSGVGRNYVAEFRHFIMYGLKRCRWLLIAFAQGRQPITEVFNSWLAWNGSRLNERRYYGTLRFGDDLCHFVRDESQALSEAATMMAAFYEAMFLAVRQPDAFAGIEESDLPALAAGVRLVDFSFRPHSVVAALRSKRLADPSCYQNTNMAFQLRERNQVAHCELPVVAAAVLRLCDGRTTVSEMARFLEAQGEAAESLLADVLGQFRESGLVRFSRVTPPRECSLAGGLLPAR